MSQRDRSDLIEQWDIYYRIVREDSPMYTLCRDSYKAMFIDHDIPRVKANAKTAHEWLINGKRLSSPSAEDPRVVANKHEVMLYNSLIRSNSISNNNEYTDI